MLELILISLSGLIVGLIVGLAPGLGVANTMIILTPWLFSLDPVNLLCFYVCVLTGSQFYGSITSVITGTAGEPGSIVAAENSKFFNSINDKIRIIKLTATGSLMGNVISSFVVGLILIFWIDLSVIFSTKLKLIVYAGSLMLFFLLEKNKKQAALALILIFLLRSIGENRIDNYSFLTFDIVELKNGLPIIPMLLGIVSFPLLIETLKAGLAYQKIEYNTELINKKVSLPVIAVGFKSSIIGTIMGLVPGIGLTSSGLVASKTSFRQTNNFLKNKFLAVYSSETANNAASVSALIPLLLFGLAIIPSETVILDFLELNGYTYFSKEQIVQLILSILPMFIVISCVNWFLSWKVGKPIIILAQRHFKILMGLVLAVLIFVLFYNGLNFYLGNNQAIYFITFTLSFLLGLIFRVVEPGILIYGIWVAPSLIETGLRSYHLYF